MSAELIGILTVGVALAALHLATLRGMRTELRGDLRTVRGELHGVRDELRGDLRAVRGELHGVRDELRGELHRVRDELRDDLHGVRDELRADIHTLDDRMRTQERSTAKLHGLLEGLREAVVVRAGPWTGGGTARDHGGEQVQG